MAKCQAAQRGQLAGIPRKQLCADSSNCGGEAADMQVLPAETSGIAFQMGMSLTGRKDSGLLASRRTC